MQRQYNEIKKKYADYVILFRLGDFYECFEEDAVIAAKILGITLTARGKGENRQKMAGIPYHALNTYLPKLVQAGTRVVIVDQTSAAEPGKIVERKVSEIITPGAIFDGNLLTQEKNNYLAFLNICKKNGSILTEGYSGKVKIILVMADISTNDLQCGEFICEFDSSVSLSANMQIGIGEILNKYEIKEIVINEDIAKIENRSIHKEKLQGVKIINEAYASDFDQKIAQKELQQILGLNSFKAWGLDGSEIIGVLHAAYNYLKGTLQKQLTLEKLQIIDKTKFMNMQMSSYKALEVFQTSSGDVTSSLFNLINKTSTSSGKRSLYRWFLQPLKDTSEINYRHDAVSNLQLVQVEVGEKKITEMLRAQADYDRFLAKSLYNRLLPSDLAALANGVQQLQELLELFSKSTFVQQNLEKMKKTGENNFLVSLLDLDLEEIAKLVKVLDRAILEPKNNITTTGFINPEYSSELDELVKQSNSSAQFLKSIELRESQRTGITMLKIKYNKVFGYYIEISNSNLSKVPSDYIRKQTLVNAERYITPELKEWEEKILTSEERRLVLEQKIFAELLELVKPNLEKIREIGEKVAVLDCLYSFALVSRENNFVRPVFNKNKSSVVIKDLKHPVLANVLAEKFVANDVNFSEGSSFQIITGPNMAGKSTYIRSVATAQLLAQVGCFVPAREAKLNIVDGIYTRIGAADNLSQNESTFMVEMVEVAYILNNATTDSLIILDEVGRGTSTYDGLAIAWSISEEISQSLKAYTMFATHYHELIELARELAGVTNLYVEVISSGKLHFTHKVRAGHLAKSYGLEVAKMAGIRSSIIKRSEKILKTLEKENDVKKFAKNKLNYAQFELLEEIEDES